MLFWDVFGKVEWKQESGIIFFFLFDMGMMAVMKRRRMVNIGAEGREGNGKGHVLDAGVHLYVGAHCFFELD